LPGEALPGLPAAAPPADAGPAEEAEAEAEAACRLRALIEAVTAAEVLVHDAFLNSSTRCNGQQQQQ
jgi:hypothetical protein